MNKAPSPRGLSAKLTGGVFSLRLPCGQPPPSQVREARVHRKGERYMKATGIVRRVDDLGRIVIPKEIRRTLRIREGDPLLTTLTPIDRFCWAIHSVVERYVSK